MILVTGGTGFLGSILIKKLIDEGNGVVATKRANSKIPESLKGSSLIRWEDVNITDYFGLEDIFQNVTRVFHCAAKISFSSNDASLMQHTNIRGTEHIVNLCLEHGCRLVHVSSVAALGPSKINKLMNEDFKWEYSPRSSPYSIAKYESEMIVWRGIMEGLKAVIVNPSIIMGKGLGEGHVASNAIFDQVAKGIPVYPTGGVGVVDVEDVADIMINLMNSGICGERFVLNSTNISTQKLLEKVSILMQKPVPKIRAGKFVLSVAWRLAKIKSFFDRKDPVISKDTARVAQEKLQYDNSKIKTLLNYSFKNIDETLLDVMEAYYVKND